MKARIPNYNTLSTLLDRLSIENVKLCHFSIAHKAANCGSAEKLALERKMCVQEEIIQGLSEELSSFFAEVIEAGSYRYMKEERTFS